MDMRDKEFDELFRSKLDGMETEPSAGVWQDITAEIDAAKHRSNPVIWLSIAAGIIVLIGAGILFIQKAPNVNSHLPGKNNIAKVPKPVTVDPSAVGPTVHTPAATARRIKLNQGGGIARSQNKTPINLKQITKVDTTSKQPEIVSNADRQLMANAPQKPVVPGKAVVPDQDVVQLAVAPPIDQTTHFTKPDQAAIATSPGIRTAPAIVKPRHKIHNFGDLVNLVVDKLDKRQDKVVQFSDDDEGDSHLTAVNLGIVKIKKGE